VEELVKELSNEGKKEYLLELANLAYSKARCVAL
jgi:hypothetical protein